MADEITEIVDFEKALLPTVLGASSNVQCNIKPLTAAGENYTTITLAVELTVIDVLTKRNRTLYCVVKTVPKNEFIRHIFQPKITFLKELEAYRTVFPILQTFQKSHGVAELIDFFPEYYGGRYGLHNPSEFDDHAIIALKNLKVLEYESVERTKGFDFVTSAMILKELAKLHAVPIALKQQQPDLFNSKIKSTLFFFNAFTNISETLKNDTRDQAFEIAAENPDCVPLLSRYRAAWNHGEAVMRDGKEPEEPFATFSHGDLWVNNILVKYQNGQPDDIKILDYQMTTYGSPGKDLSFFIFVSVQNDVVLNRFDELLEIYYNTFIDTLKDLKADTKLFTFEALMNEIGNSVRDYTLTQCSIMLNPVFAPSNNVRKVEDLSAEFFAEKPIPTQLHKEKLWMMLKEFAKRQWI